MAEKTPKIMRNRLMEGGYMGKTLHHEAKAAHQAPEPTLPAKVRAAPNALKQAFKHLKGL